MPRPVVSRLAATAFVVLAVLAGGPPRAGAAAGPVELTAQVDRRPVADGTERDPVRLRPDGSVAVTVRLRNAGSTDVTVRAVRLEGRVMGLAFFAYDALVDLTVPARRSRTLRYTIDLAGLRGQATGLIPGRVVALGPDRRELASQATVFDVRGSLASVYGAFGLAVAGFTALSLAGALLALPRPPLGPHPRRRGMRLRLGGLGGGPPVARSEEGPGGEKGKTQWGPHQ